MVTSPVETVRPAGSMTCGLGGGHSDGDRDVFLVFGCFRSSNLFVGTETASTGLVVNQPPRGLTRRVYLCAGDRSDQMFLSPAQGKAGAVAYASVGKAFKMSAAWYRACILASGNIWLVCINFRPIVRVLMRLSTIPFCHFPESPGQENSEHSLVPRIDS